MQFRQFLWAAILPVLFAPAGLTAATPPSSLPPSESERSRHAKTSGLLTDRLTPQELKRWAAITRLVLAVDNTGQPHRPTLRSLWEWAETSGHIIQIELPRPVRSYAVTAGSFEIERLDPQGLRHVAVIRLYLATIDQASTDPAAARADGSIPFQGLSCAERYAEVLGHELGQAADILTNLPRAQMVEEVIKQTNELLLSITSRKKSKQLSQEMQQRLDRRDAFLKELEAPAETVETAIWRELVSSQKAKAVPQPAVSLQRK